MANPIPNLFKVPELKEKILFTLLVLFIYRVGAHITVPGVEAGNGIQGVQGTARPGDASAPLHVRGSVGPVQRVATAGNSRQALCRHVDRQTSCH